MPYLLGGFVIDTNWSNLTTSGTGTYWFQTSDTSSTATSMTIANTLPALMQWAYDLPLTTPIIEDNSRASREAHDAAVGLLEEYLDPDQLTQYDQDLSFDVITNKGNRYRVRFGFSRNVDRLDERGEPVERFCLHPTGQTYEVYPEEDVMLAQKLILETDEDYFRNHANITRLAA